MFSTSFLTAIGLLLEMIGLSLLFTDLLRSKSLSDATAAIHTLQEDLNVSTRDLLMNLNTHVALLSDFMSKYAGILAKEAEFEAEAQSARADRDQDPERQKLIAYILDKGPDGLRRSMARELQTRIKALPTEEKVAEAAALNLVTASEILTNHAKYRASAELLRKLATVGISFVAVGASLQFIDLFV